MDIEFVSDERGDRPANLGPRVPRASAIRFAAAGRPGAYHRVPRDGEIAAGDRIDVVSRPAHGVTSALVSPRPEAHYENREPLPSND